MIELNPLKGEKRGPREEREEWQRGKRVRSVTLLHYCTVVCTLGVNLASMMREKNVGFNLNLFLFLSFISLFPSYVSFLYVHMMGSFNSV